MTCVHCGETRLVEQIGLVTFCAVCGRTSPVNCAEPGTGLLGTSGPPRLDGSVRGPARVRSKSNPEAIS